MKTTRTAKALVSVALVIAMLFSMCVVGIVGASAADALNLTYDFAYNNAGYAEGRISLSGTSGTYILYWSDDTAALAGYTGIAQITVNSGTKYYEMPANTAIPAGATKVIAVDSTKEATVANASAVFEIPATKQFKGGAKQYDFMALSDIHIDYGNYYKYAKEHLANSLEVAAKRDVEFIATCGDNMNGNTNGTAHYADEWNTYLKILAASNYNNPIYEANGNHETYWDDGKTSDPYDFGLNMFKNATGLNTTTGKLQSAPYFEKTINGDHYIFMTMELITKNQHPGMSNTFSDAQLNWLEGLLNKYKNDGHKIFIYEHAPFKNYGAGDNKVTPYYGAAMIDSYPNVKRFKSLLEANKDVIAFSGHTHIDFKYGYNFDNENGTTAYTVHIPSNASTTHPNSSGGLDYPMDINSSQGYLVDVYEDYVVLNGTDLAFNLICPSYTYLVDYTGEALDKNEIPDIVFDEVKVTVDVSNLTDAPTGVICCAVNEGNAANNVQIPMTRNADGTYSAKVIEGYSSIYFQINSAAGILKTKSFPVANCKIVLGYQTLTYTPTTAVTNVRAHVWGDGGDGTVWPGILMTKGADGSYSVRVPDSDYTGVVFNWNDAAGQTDDLIFDNYAKPGVSDVYTEVDQPATEPTTAPVTTVPTTTVKPTEAPATTVPATTAKPTEAPATTVATEPTEVTTVPATTAATEPTEVTTVPATTAEPTEATTAPTFTLPTEATEDESIPTTTATVDETTLPVETTTLGETTATQPTTTLPVDYLYGDVDLDGKVNIKDVTTIQKFIAKLITIDDTAMIQADVNADETVNIKDATTIQKFLAKLMDKFPVEEGTELAAVGAYIPVVAVGALKDDVKKALSTEYQYASYDAYMALKKAYMNNVSDAELTTAFNNYKTMKGNNPLSNPGGTANIGDINIGATGQGKPSIPGPSFGGNSGGNNGGNTGGDVTGETITVYFTNNKGWAGAYIYGFNGVAGETATGEPLGAYPGKAMTYVRDNSQGQKIYSYEVPADIDYIKFSDGAASNERTDNIAKGTFTDGTGFYLTEKGSKYWGVETYTYEGGGSDTSSTAAGGNSGGDVTGETITVYFTNNKGWAGAYIYGFNGVAGETATGEPLGVYPGKAMTYVRDNSQGQKIYSYEVPADIDYIKFSDGAASNERTDNIAKGTFTDGTGFYLTEKGSKYWGVETYTYEGGGSDTPSTTAKVPETTQGGNSGNTGNTGNTITVYFTNNKGWAGAYIYGFNGVAGETATGEPLGAYPGKAMTYVRENGQGQKIYSYEVPADIDYIKFSDGAASNERTDNIAKGAFTDGTGFYLTEKGSKYWGVETYTYGEGGSDTPSTTADVPETTTGGNTGGNTGTYTVYAINSAKWDAMAAHAWNDGGSAAADWPGTVMTKTSEKVNGFDVYSVTFSKEYTKIIFNNNKKDGAAQTGNLTFEAGKYFDVKGGKWYASLKDVPASSGTGTDRYLAGSFNGWSQVANEFISTDGVTGYVELELAANTEYQFKIIREGTWTSCKETLSITDTASNLTFSSSVSDNVKLTTKSAGTYVFAFGISTSQLSVTYP